MCSCRVVYSSDKYCCYLCNIYRERERETVTEKEQMQVTCDIYRERERDSKRERTSTRMREKERGRESEKKNEGRKKERENK